ncbi:MAG TPA: hypothetical protein VJV78_34330 [Polyangiales bacterium]|nr:hypothetical protein [Polyangiales bacterium]
MRRLLLLCVLGSALTAQRAHAQGNDLFGPAGGRSALMGNTGVALGRDGAAPIYNPAGIVRVNDERLAFSANFYSLNLTTFSDWHQPGDVDSARFGARGLDDSDLTDYSFRLLPTSLCLFFTLEELAKLTSGGAPSDKPARGDVHRKLAVCFASLEPEDLDMQALHFEGETQAGPTSQVQSMQRRWTRVYIGPTYSMHLDDALAFGASLQVVYTRMSFGIHSTALSTTLDGGGVGSSLASSGEGRTFGLVASLGATYQYGDVTFGLNVRSPMLHVYGSYSETSERSLSASSGSETVLASASGSLHTPPPIRIALGTGLSLGRLTLEVDAALNIAARPAVSAELDVQRSRLTDQGVDLSRIRQQYSEAPSHTTLNPSAGAEYSLTDGLSLLAGISLNFSALDPLEPTVAIGNLAQARTNHASVAAGIGSYWNEGELLFGIQFDYGWGDAIAANPYTLPNRWSVIDTDSYTLLFVVSGSTSLKAIVRTVNKITGADE